ncbi:outer membrane beta-barrel family protein [Arenibacter sp. GZD96]|uniref:outer membrane beta-barrel family protein n=1 Tax=Aurantibrevibacter litoralis TaxID=3106030 RepID=UPI002AFF13EC|nr:outer membrane beta-barrel family protein [Arenibacter sp. GZD-96]MEA1786580.1 outer membrane beta-barrel family protein [Arenibacter sp. GZD-96]
MKYLIPLGLCFFLMPMVLIGQEFTLSGWVKDQTNEPIPFANVYLLRIADTTMIKGVSTDENGFFQIENVVSDLYFMQASYMGKFSPRIPLDISKDTHVGTLIITIEAEMLDEVVVTAKQPTMERKADRIVFNVENTVVSEGSSWQILKNTPGVISMQDEFLIRNQNATIYLNDRKVQLSSSEVKDLLEGLSGSAIKSVEVIPNPPARYEAEGGPILNIITTRNVAAGYKGGVTGTFTQAIFPKYALGTSHYFKSDKLNVFANYTISPKKEFKEDEYPINFIDESNTIFSRWTTDFNKLTRSAAQNANVILDYAFNDRNSLNVTSNLVFSPDKSFQNNLQTEIRNGQNLLDSTLTTNSRLDNDNTNIAVDLSYKYLPKREVSMLTINAHYTAFTEDQKQRVSSDYFNPSGDFIRNFSFFTNARQNVDIATGQLDYVTPLEGATWETGAKFSSIRSRSGIDFFNVQGGNQVFNPEFSDDFIYNENVWAGYISMSKDWEKWSIKGGVRGEYTDVEGKSLTLDTENIQNFFKLFPTIYLLHSPSDIHSFSFDYSRRLQRPKYQDLNPFRYFVNENDFFVGNPTLQPTFSHNFNLNYSLKGTYFFDIYYRDNGNYISDLSFQDNQNLTLRQIRQNVLESTSYGLDFTYSKSLTNFWYLYSYMSLFAEDETFLAEESGNQPYTNKVEGYYVSLNNYLTLSKDGTFTGEVAFTYFSRFLQGNYVLGSSTDLTLGLRKSLWNKRAVISVAAEDLLKKAVSRQTARYLNQDNAYFSQPETRFVRFGFTYNFGNFRLQDNQRRIDNKERDRLAQ